MRVVSFKLEEDMLELLDYIAEKTHTPRSVIIRHALKEYTQRHKLPIIKTRRLIIY